MLACSQGQGWRKLWRGGHRLLLQRARFVPLCLLQERKQDLCPGMCTLRKCFLVRVSLTSVPKVAGAMYGDVLDLMSVLEARHLLC